MSSLTVIAVPQLIEVYNGLVKQRTGNWTGEGWSAGKEFGPQDHYTPEDLSVEGIDPADDKLSKPHDIKYDNAQIQVEAGWNIGLDAATILTNYHTALMQADREYLNDADKYESHSFTGSMLKVGSKIIFAEKIKMHAEIIENLKDPDYRAANNIDLKSLDQILTSATFIDMALEKISASSTVFPTPPDGQLNDFYIQTLYNPSHRTEESIAKLLGASPAPFSPKNLADLSAGYSDLLGYSPEGAYYDPGEILDPANNGFNWSEDEVGLGIDEQIAEGGFSNEFLYFLRELDASGEYDVNLDGSDASITLPGGAGNDTLIQYSPPPTITPPTQGTCFAAGTLVRMADGSERAIEMIAAGDAVLAFSPAPECVGAALIPSTVARIFAHDDCEVFDVSGARVTAEHPFQLSDGRFVEVCDLRPGDRLVRADGTFVAFGGAVAVPGLHRTYNFEVERLHTYVANGFRVHNKAGVGAPVVLDLDGDGLVDLVNLDSSATFFDMDADGFIENTGWAAANEGILAIDLDADGAITVADEFVFANQVAAAETDLEAIQLLYDTNGDNFLTDADTDWAKFRVWQDLDQDAVSDAGEVKTLAETGISSIRLDGTPAVFTGGTFDAGAEGAAARNIFRLRGIALSKYEMPYCPGSSENGEKPSFSFSAANPSPIFSSPMISSTFRSGSWK